jgi:hypothetical protein
MPQPKDITARGGGVSATELPSNRAPLSHSIILIAACLAVDLFLMWVVRVDLFLDLLAEATDIVIFLLGVGAGTLLYRRLSKSLPHGARLTAAITLGLSIAMAAMELTSSHKLVRAFGRLRSDDDD